MKGFLFIEKISSLFAGSEFCKKNTKGTDT